MLYLILLLVVSVINYELGYIVGKKLGNVYGIFTYDPNTTKVEIKLEEMPDGKKDYIILKYEVKEVDLDE